MPSSTVSRRRTAVTAPRSGGQASAIAVLLLGAGAFGWWFWKRRRDAAGDAGGGRRPKKGGSSFRFPGMKRGTGAAAAAGAHPKSGTVPRGAPAVKVAGMRRAASSGGGGAAGGGNPKQSNKRARREEKAARKEAKAGKGLELIHNAQIRQKDEESQGSNVIRYVDLNKTDEVYDKVREYQETGKKRYP